MRRIEYLFQSNTHYSLPNPTYYLSTPITEHAHEIEIRSCLNVKSMKNPWGIKG